MRVSRDEMLINIARVSAMRATCLRLSVGAAIAKEGRIISTGYNGSPAGTPHCDESNCTSEQACTRTIHAEAGAISFAARHGVSLNGASMYLTHAPCLDCAKLMINTGIVEVVYDIPYRKTDGVDLLRSVGILVREYGIDQA